MDTPTKPHGWAGTLKGKMLHYFGMDRDGSLDYYRPDGSPIALCHNALVKDGGEMFKADLPGDRAACRACEKYLAEYFSELRRTGGRLAGALSSATGFAPGGAGAGAAGQIQRGEF